MVIFVIIGALIGAGFASGQEIYSFFYSYGIIGMLGLLVMSILIVFLIYKTLKIILLKEIDNYNEFLNVFIKNRKIIKIINIIINALLLATFYIMIAGFGAYFEQELGVAKIIGSFILVVMCLIVFFTNVKGVLKVSEYIVPILIILIMILGIKSVSHIDLTNIQIPITKKWWFLSSITYCSYNIILLIPVLISLRKYIKKPEKIKFISIFSGIILLMMSMIIFILLTKIDTDISNLEMPIVYAVRTQFMGFSKIYAFIILASIFTTAISVGIGFLQNISKSRFSYPQVVLFMCITGLLFSNLGFSKLVNFAYPLFGYLGIIQIILILSKNICKK